MWKWTRTAKSGEWAMRPISTTAPLPKTSRHGRISWPARECAWIKGDLEKQAKTYAIREIVPEHLGEIREAGLELIEKTRAAVQDRLTKEIAHWDRRAEELKAQEQAGKQGARLNSGEARRRADDMRARLDSRLQELELEALISPFPPVVLGGVLVVPKGLIDLMKGRTPEAGDAKSNKNKMDIAARGREIVMDVERKMGHEPTDREFEKLGYDIESRIPDSGKLRFIEVKAREGEGRNDHRDPERDLVLPEQAERLYPCHRVVRRRYMDRCPQGALRPVALRAGAGYRSVQRELHGGGVAGAGGGWF